MTRAGSPQARAPSSEGEADRAAVSFGGGCPSAADPVSAGDPSPKAPHGRAAHAARSVGSGATAGALTSREAASRLARDGFNELPSAKPRTPWAIAWEVVREPMFLLLIGAAAIYLALGDRREALALLASVGVTDLEKYAVKPGTPLFPDFFV